MKMRSSWVTTAAYFLSAQALTIPKTSLPNLPLNVPPYSVNGDLSGRALAPRYNSPREVFLFNPSVNLPGRKRATTVVDQPSTGLAAAIYTMTNGVNSSNIVVAIPVYENGTIDEPAFVLYNNYNKNNTDDVQLGARFPYGGTTYQDALDSQSSLVSTGSRVFVVNAGSNSFSMWAINCTDPTQLFAVAVVPVNGDYPNTLAVAVTNQVVCVGTTGQISGIECFTYDVGQDALATPQYFSGSKQAVPMPIEQGEGLPSGPPNTLSQLLFTDDEKYLVVIVKGAANSSGEIISPGYINVYPMSSSGLGDPVQSTPSGTAFLFGCTFLYNTYNMFCADPGVGTVYLSMDSATMEFSVTQTTSSDAIEEGSSNCWTSLSPYSNGPFYADAVNDNYFAAFDTSSGDLLNTYVFNNGNPQLIEMATANNFVYGLTFGVTNSSGYITNLPAITVARDLNLAGGFQLEQVAPLVNHEGGTDGTSWEGLAVFVPSDPTNVCDFT